MKPHDVYRILTIDFGLEGFVLDHYEALKSKTWKQIFVELKKNKEDVWHITKFFPWISDDFSNLAYGDPGRKYFGGYELLLRSEQQLQKVIKEILKDRKRCVLTNLETAYEENVRRINKAKF